MKRSAIACPNGDTLVALLRNLLPEGEQAALATHLEECSLCQRAFEAIAADDQSWRDAAESLSSEHAATTVNLRGVIAILKACPSASGDTRPTTASDTIDLSFLAPPSGPGEIGRIKHYRILEVVGRGGFGIVFKAFDEQLQRIVAVKALAPALATGQPARDRFQREARAGARITHPNVVAIYAVDETNGVPFLVMEFVAGESLQARLTRTGALPLHEALRIGMQAARGLAAAHRQDLVHRDVKPGNILLEDGTLNVKITDFGLARVVDETAVSVSGIITGTPHYMAPEQARGDSTIDHRADLFSLGSVLYATVTGREPFHATSVYGVLHHVVEGKPTPICVIDSSLPDWLEDLIADLHVKDANKRIQSADEVAEVLSQHLAHMKDPVAHAAPFRPKRRAPSRMPWVAAVIAALGLFMLASCAAIGTAVTLGWFAWRDRPGPGVDGRLPEVDDKKPPDGRKWWDDKKPKPPPDDKKWFDEKKGFDDWPPPDKKKPPKDFKKKDFKDFDGKKGFDFKKGLDKKPPPPPEFDKVSAIPDLTPRRRDAPEFCNRCVISSLRFCASA